VSDPEVVPDSRGLTQAGDGPLRPGPVGPAAIVIFGATGDLTKRKLIPALYNLSAGALLAEEIAVVGVARRERTSEDFREEIAGEMREYATGALDPALTDRLMKRLSYVTGSFDDDATYPRLAAELERVEREHGTGGNVLFYLATGPEHFAPAVEGLGRAGLAAERGTGFRRVVVEKPFGHDLASARELNARLRAVLAERQIYRIDHYLGKETVQNLLVFRFGNGIFEPIWNRRYVENVQITVAESLGVEDRGGYYESAGALRDMVPNHLLQLLALTGMEPPTSFEAEAVREERAKVLRSIQRLTPERVLTEAVRGQYDAGVIDGRRVPAYRAEPRVDPSSSTETYVALKLSVDNWRWAGVPFYLRTGKRLKQRVSEIAVQFRRPPLLLFRDTPVEHLARNVLLIRVAPEEGISLRFGAKVPGPLLSVGGVTMDFRYQDHFGATASTGYETLLWDAIRGDPTLFQRADMIEAGWSLVDPVLEVWSALPARSFPNYAAGTWGPAAADELLARDGREWRRIEP
jgi:glucose-6-phosphate 1-dehydrogenase